MSNSRVFYKSTISFTVLSQEPILKSLEEIFGPKQKEDGYVFLDSESIVSILSAKDMAKTLAVADVDPEVFGLTEDGEDLFEGRE